MQGALICVMLPRYCGRGDADQAPEGADPGGAQPESGAAQAIRPFAFARAGAFERAGWAQVAGWGAQSSVALSATAVRVVLAAEAVLARGRKLRSRKSGT